MASTALARISGSVLSVPAPRGGIIKNGPRAGEEWTIETVNVLVADQNVTAVQLPRRDSTGQLLGLGENVRSILKGDVVDFLCEVSVYGQEVQFRVLETFPADDVSSYLVSA
jgi:hypothetical protein